MSPWPGKCLAHAATPAARKPRTKATPWRATSAGSAPNERTPMTGLAGLLLTSTHGARSSVMPASAIIAPMALATAEVSRDVVDLSERGVAREAAPHRHLQPRDVAALLVGGHDWLAPASRRLAVRSATRAPSTMLLPNRQTPPSPPSSRRRSHRGATGPRNEAEEAAVDDGVEVHVSP